MEIQRYSLKRRDKVKLDIPTLKTMCDYFTPLESWLKDRLSNASDIIYCVKGDTLLGYLIANKKRTYLEIELICVGAEGRAMKGIGTKLMERCEQIALDYGLRELQLDSQLQAEGFYGKLGYTEVFRTKNSIRMKKRLSP
jgi:ribosomal protein S18 acetylase RimI-like enzyme